MWSVSQVSSLRSKVSRIALWGCSLNVIVIKIWRKKIWKRKIWKFVENLKICRKSENLSKIWKFVGKKLSSMSQRSLGSLFNVKKQKWLSHWVSEWQGHLLSCQVTANNSWRDNSSYRLYTLGPLCLWQCFLFKFWLRASLTLGVRCLFKVQNKTVFAAFI